MPIRRRPRSLWLPSTCLGRVGQWLAMVALTWAWGAVAVPAEPPEGPTSPIEPKLASVLARQANDLLRAETPTVAGLELAVELYRLAIDLAPDDAEILRGFLDVARLAERDDLRRDLVKRLASLDPRDERVRLERINDWLSSNQTADALVAAYEKLLQPEQIRALGGPVASRMAFDLALLHRRRDDVPQFAEWLARATVLDQTNKAAAATAAGYFQLQIDDPFAQAELLVNLLLADPTDLTTQAALARHLLLHGAYHGAARMYRLAAATHTPLKRAAPHDLLADLAIAEWAAGDTNAAKATIRARERDLNRVVQRQAWQDDPLLDPAERAKIIAAVPATLAVVKLAILERESDLRLAEELATIRTNLLEALGKATEADDDVRASTLLSIALMTAWFGRDADAETLADLVARAEAIKPLSDEARARFDGWIAFRRGDLDQAVDRLSTTNDSFAKLGLALVRLNRDEPDGAVSLLREVAELEPGSLIGIWSARKLSDLSPAAGPALSEAAQQMEELVSALPRAIDRLAADPTELVSIRVEPLKRVFSPYEPILVRVTISNNSGLPLGIGSDSPIHPMVIIQPRLTVAHQPRITGAEPIVLDMGRRLHLAPRDRSTVVIDLWRYRLGALLNGVAVEGAMIELSATLNAHPREERVLEPDTLGSTYRTPLFRMNGVNASAEWIETATVSISDPGRHPDPTTMALLSQLILATNVRSADLRAALDHAREALPAAFPRLLPNEQAWLMAVLLPGHANLEPLFQLARSSEHENVQIMYLLKNLTGPDDPMLLAAQRSRHARLQRIGALIAQMIEQSEKMKQQTERSPTTTGR